AVIDEERLAPLIHAEIFHPSIQDQPVSVFVFYCPIARNLKTHDELEYLGYFTDHELNRVINQFNHLPTTIIPDDAPATWADYGKIWGPIHAAAFERVKELGL